MVRQSIAFTEKQLDSLRKESEYTGLGVSEIIRRSIDLYLRMYAQAPTLPDVSDIDEDAEWFTREQVDRLMQSKGLSWRSGINTSIATQ